MTNAFYIPAPDVGVSAVTKPIAESARVVRVSIHFAPISRTKLDRRSEMHKSALYLQSTQPPILTHECKLPEIRVGRLVIGQSEMPPVYQTQRVATKMEILEISDHILNALRDRRLTYPIIGNAESPRVYKCIKKGATDWRQI